MRESTTKIEEGCLEKKHSRSSEEGLETPAAKHAKVQDVITARTVSRSSSPGLIHLNIGGKRLLTTRTTLDKCPFFEKLLKHDETGSAPAKRDEKGAIFCDRNGETFSLVLDYLRDNALPAYEDTDDLRRLLIDAQFYGLEDLAQACDERLAHLESEKLSKEKQPTTVFLHLGSTKKSKQPSTKESDEESFHPSHPKTPVNSIIHEQEPRAPLSSSAFNNDDF